MGYNTLTIGEHFGGIMGKNRTMDAKRVKYIRQSKARPRALRMNHGHMKTGQSVDRSKIPEEYLGLFAYRERAKVGPLEDFLAAKFPTHVINREVQTLALRHSVLVETRFVKTVMFFDAAEECFYFTEFQCLPGVLRKSITYGTRNRAVSCYEQRTIRWKEVIHIPNVE